MNTLYINLGLYLLFIFSKFQYKPKSLIKKKKRKKYVGVWLGSRIYDQFFKGKLPKTINTMIDRKFLTKYYQFTYETIFTLYSF